MKRYIYSLLMLAALGAAAPASAAPECNFEYVGFAEPQAVEATVDFNGKERELLVNNASGELLRVYDVTGMVVLEVRLTSESQKVELSSLKRGCYIVTVGRVKPKKISVR